MRLIEKTIPVLTPDDTDFSAYERETDARAKVRPATAYVDEVVQLLEPRTAAPRSAARLPFRGCDMEFRPGESTIWSGFNGSGKSMLQGQVMGWMASRGQRVCIASFEMKPARTLMRMVRQSLGNAAPSRAAVDELLSSWAGQLWLYDQQGSVQADRMLSVVRYCGAELGIQHVAIDSLTKCIRGEDDYNAQKNFVDGLTTAARDHDVHAHLVAHLRKPITDHGKMPTRMDIRGAGAISDLVDNVLILWRNKAKEQARDEGKAFDASDPDAVLGCDKHRNGEWEGKQRLWFNVPTMTYSDTPPLSYGGDRGARQ